MMAYFSRSMPWLYEQLSGQALRLVANSRSARLLPVKVLCEL